MELILQTGLEHQQIPVDSICDVLSGVFMKRPDPYYSNPELDLKDVQIGYNIDKVQTRNGINPAIRNQSLAGTCLNLDIKMETGTGKTYVYTHTIYELHKRYGINKFVIAVPTLPIKAGTQSFIADPYVQKHFKDTCGYGTNIELYVLSAVKPKKKGRHFFPSAIRAFVESSCQMKNRIYVLLVNLSLLTSGNQLRRKDYDYGVHGFYRPFDAIRATRPFVIIDEPHKFSKVQKGFSVIQEELKPQCIIRFGATFPFIAKGKGKNKMPQRDYENLLYDLNACTAFNKNLIKGVAKEHFQPEDSKNEKIKITAIENKESVTFSYQTLKGNKSFTLHVGDSMGIISEKMSGLTVNGIGKGSIILSNGQEKKTGEEFQVNAYSSSYQEQMLRLALQRHFETERKNFERGIRIKTLALFFIDNIESYRGDREGNGAWLRDTFDRLLTEELDKELEKDNSNAYCAYLEASKADIAACRAGYFAQDNQDTDEAIAKEVDDILHNKKELLSFYKADGSINTRRFLFSKWTLKEGWDNPNVFTIAKLRSSGSENSKLQEVGRGLRLPVDEYGNRISNEEFMLNYIVDFSDADFADKLVKQINEDLPFDVTSVLPAKEIERVALMKEMDSMELMLALYTKKYITDIKGTLNPEKLVEFFEEYPEFNTGVSKSKIVDRNKHTTNTVRVRKAQFEELRDFWEVLNRKYILFFEHDVNRLIEESFLSVLENDVFGYQTVKSERSVIDTSKGRADVVSESGVEYLVTGRKMPYRDFLIRANKATSVPVRIIHKAICRYADKHGLNNAFINENSLSCLIQAFEEWKCSNLQGRFKYKKADYETKVTALTNKDGSMKPEIVQGAIGIHLEAGIVSEKYLYDAIAYDSDLEKANIKSEIEEVIVYGKIPRRSISIPTIANSSYSPDFMYVVRKKNGDKELNVIIETKDVENKANLRGNELAKINSARSFFEQLKLDGYNIHFKTQLNNKGMKAIISELLMK